MRVKGTCYRLVLRELPPTFHALLASAGTCKDLNVDGGFGVAQLSDNAVVAVDRRIVQRHVTSGK